MNVSGKPILAVRGKPLQPLRGKGFHCTEDGSTYIADLSGKIEMSNGKIRISAVYEIPGDVGIGTGNVEYHGDVVIHGGIKPGAKVSTSGSLTVDGICENCVIEAEKILSCEAVFSVETRPVFVQAGISTQNFSNTVR